VNFNVFNLSHEDVMDPLIDRLTRVVECNCREVIDNAHPVTVEAVSGQENLIFEVYCEPGDEGLIIGAPGRPWTDPPGNQRVGAVLEVEKPLQKAVTRVVLEAYESAMAGESVPND
jgi:hypothetical protein